MTPYLPTADQSQEPSTTQRVVDATAVGLDVAVRSGEAVAAGCDLFGVLCEGALGLLAGLFG